MRQTPPVHENVVPSHPIRGTRPDMNVSPGMQNPELVGIAWAAFAPYGMQYTIGDGASKCGPGGP
jgi:hypothetical protein